jgi:hypothetical protein
MIASGRPEWERIHLMIRSASEPSARIAARSITEPPDGPGRERRVTTALMVASGAGSHME